MRTDKQIVDETNELARLCLRHLDTGYEAPEGHKFYEAEDPRSKAAWQRACEIQQLLSKTDPNDALSALDTDDKEEDEPVVREYGVRLWGTFRACTEDTIEATSFEEAVKKAESLSLGNYTLRSFEIETLDGDESVTVYGPDDDDPNDDDNPWCGDGVSVELHDEGEPLSWEAVQLVKDLAELDMSSTDAFHSTGGWGKINALASRAKRACTKITGGIEG